MPASSFFISGDLDSGTAPVLRGLRVFQGGMAYHGFQLGSRMSVPGRQIRSSTADHSLNLGKLNLKTLQKLQVAERGLAFVRSISDVLGARQANGKLPPLFREAWAFSACVSLAGVTHRANAALRARQISAAEGQQTLDPAPGCASTLRP